MRFKTFLFDLDGTLIDHFSAIHRCYAYTMAQIARPIPDPATVRAAVGGGLENALARFVPPEDFDRALRIYRKHWEEIMLDDVAFMPGGLELLSALHARGATLAVVSNKLGDSSRKVCDKLGISPLVRLVIGAHDTPWLKPQAEFTAHVMKLLDAESSTTLLIGDSPYDIQAAHNGDLPAWCVTTGTHGPDELRLAGADAVYPNLAELRLALGI